TVTGDISVITGEHIDMMKDGAILANSGHFDCEIEINSMKSRATDVKRIRENLDQYTLKDGRKLFLIGEGRLVNLAAAEGHPASVMDMSFANQALASEWAVKNRKQLTPKVYDVPSEVENWVAKLKLSSMGIRIDTLSKEQQQYLSSWSHGT